MVDLEQCRNGGEAPKALWDFHGLVYPDSGMDKRSLLCNFFFIQVRFDF